jgi:hypothetical protein
MNNNTKSTLATCIALALPLLAFAATCYEPYTETGCGTGLTSGSRDLSVCPNGMVAWRSTTGRFNTARAASSGRTSIQAITSNCEVVITYTSPCTASGQTPAERTVFTKVPSQAAIGNSCSSPSPI